MRIEFKESMENPIWIGTNTLFFHKVPFLPIEQMENIEQVNRYLLQQFKFVKEDEEYYFIYRIVENSTNLYYRIYCLVDSSHETYFVVDFIKASVVKESGISSLSISPKGQSIKLSRLLFKV